MFLVLLSSFNKITQKAVIIAVKFITSTLQHFKRIHAAMRCSCNSGTWGAIVQRRTQINFTGLQPTSRLRWWELHTVLGPIWRWCRSQWQRRRRLLNTATLRRGRWSRLGYWRWCPWASAATTSAAMAGIWCIRS